MSSPEHARAATPVPARKKPSFAQADGTVNVTEVPPMKWDVTDASDADDRPDGKSVSRSPSGGRKGKGRGKSKKGKSRSRSRGGAKGKGKKGRGKGDRR